MSMTNIEKAELAAIIKYAARRGFTRGEIENEAFKYGFKRSTIRKYIRIFRHE